MPLSQFGVGSKEFEQALSEFNTTQLTDTKGIRPEILNQHFFPSQNLALQEVFKDHEEKRSEQKIGILVCRSRSKNKGVFDVSSLRSSTER